MGRLETNDWIVLNDIIFLIYSTKTTEEMQDIPSWLEPDEEDEDDDPFAQFEDNGDYEDGDDWIDDNDEEEDENEDENSEE